MTVALQPYRDAAHFAELHAAGRMELTASMVPSLFPIELRAWRPRPYAVAAHVEGSCPLPELDGPMLTRGKRLEKVALEMLQEQWPDEPVVQAFGFAKHLDLPLIASPDALLGEDGIGEVKVVTPTVYRDHWRDGPPLDVMIQHQSQYSCCPDAVRGFILPLVVGDHEFFLAPTRTEPHERSIRAIEDTVGRFMDNLRKGIWPDPEDAQHDSVARAMEQMFRPDKAAPPLALNDPEAAKRLDQWVQAETDKKAAMAVIKAHKRWFTARVGKAPLITVGNSGEIKRTTSPVKAQAARPATKQTRWKLKDLSTDDEDDEE